MTQNPPLFLLPIEEKFDGSNWVAFKMIITEAACGHGLLEYLNGNIVKPETKMLAVTMATATSGVQPPQP